MPPAALASLSDRPSLTLLPTAADRIHSRSLRCRALAEVEWAKHAWSAGVDPRAFAGANAVAVEGRVVQAESAARPRKRKKVQTAARSSQGGKDQAAAVASTAVIPAPAAAVASVWSRATDQFLHGQSLAAVFSFLSIPRRSRSVVSFLSKCESFRVLPKLFPDTRVQMAVGRAEDYALTISQTLRDTQRRLGTGGSTAAHDALLICTFLHSFLPHVPLILLSLERAPRSLQEAADELSGGLAEWVGGLMSSAICALSPGDPSALPRRSQLARRARQVRGNSKEKRTCSRRRIVLTLRIIVSYLSGVIVACGCCCFSLWLCCLTVPILALRAILFVPLFH